MVGKMKFHGDAGDLYNRADNVVSKEAGRNPGDQTELTVAKRLVHELKVHQVEMEMQNDELRRAQAELSAERARYFDLYDLAPVGYFTVNEKGTILAANITAASLLGLVRTALARQQLSRFIFLEDQDLYYQFLKQIIPEGASEECEMRMLRADNTAFWAHLLASKAQNGECRITFKNITERKQAEEEVKRSLEEKNVMLKEIHHRVRNNMQVISSLLNLQAREIADATVRALFEESRGRISSMAMVHEWLYRSNDFAHIDFKEYLQHLTEEITKTYKRSEITVLVDMERVELDMNAGIPCGLIVNELITNSLKHAFPDGRTGTIRAGITRTGEGNNVLSVSDDGIGFPANINFRDTASLGLKLVNVLSGQIHGKLEMVVDGGTKFSVSFPGQAGQV